MATELLMDTPAVPPTLYPELQSNGILDFDDDEEDELVDELAEEEPALARQGDRGVDDAQVAVPTSRAEYADSDQDEREAMLEADVLRPIQVQATTTVASLNGDVLSKPSHQDSDRWEELLGMTASRPGKDTAEEIPDHPVQRAAQRVREESGKEADTNMQLSDAFFGAEDDSSDHPIGGPMKASPNKGPGANTVKAALNALGSTRPARHFAPVEEEPGFDLDAEIAAYEAEQASEAQRSTPLAQPPAATPPSAPVRMPQRSISAPQNAPVRRRPMSKAQNMTDSILNTPAGIVPDEPESSISALTVMAASIRMKLKERESRAVKEKALPEPGRTGPVESALWVDKHRPQHFTELIGDDRLHREAMAWLKQWDQCVFKRKPKKRAREDPVALANVLPGGKVPWADPYGRPAERVLMISGPPGLGKTTLAHIIATQAGYGVFELNASDARNAGAVENVVKSALQSASLKHPKRPTLVLIDEIDGATGGAAGHAGAGSSDTGGEGGFIRALVKLLEGGKYAKSKAKGKGYSKPLLRPIICVCNDAYAPALRALRPMAKMIRYHRPPTQTLVKRLREVCELENMRADTRSLSILVDMAQGDVRACVNALQFLKTRSDTITEAHVHGAASALGLKDGGANMHRVWDLLFHAPSSRERARNLDGKDSKSKMDQIVREATLCGDFDKVALGCFEHYLNLVLVDDGWARFKEAHDWLYFAGCLQDSVWKNGGTGTFDMLGYMPWTFVPWHNLFANTKNTMPDYPRNDYEHFVKRTAFAEITSSLHISLPPTLRTQFNAAAVITELGPSLMRMINPDLRPVNSQLVRVDERKKLSALVNIMLHLNLRFTQDRTEEGSLVMRLEPPLDAFVQYEGRRSKDVASSRFAVRQLVAREMEAEIQRRRAGVASGEDGSTAKSAGAQKVLAQYMPAGPGSRRDGDDEDGGVVLKSKLAEKVAVDFFGRVVGKPSGSKKQTRTGDGGPRHTASIQGAKQPSQGQKRVAEPVDGEPPTKKLKVFFRYHEGFSNAVRKKITLAQLL
ncbi:Chromosome transmission fidelity protein 18 [Tilletia horrida]|uniref:Chromosome transmission fidelity protein 18 n=1 Tax=Tilletia horrida TaxID=155126 RepID=A0AAN6GQI8_9BASI|nr:Chromosome transmission fidelity protein 18 [Tilletia horrida]KAK0568646.1 Chromosome transmission fidelity protein 18 [Tilletia horrida]